MFFASKAHAVLSRQTLNYAHVDYEPSPNRYRMCVSCLFLFTDVFINSPLSFLKGKWSFGGIPPGFNAIWGWGRNAPAERAPAGQNRPQTQFRSPGEMPEAHAKHAHNSFFSGMFLGLTGQWRTRGQTKPPLRPHVGGGITPRFYYIYLPSPIDHFFHPV